MTKLQRIRDLEAMRDFTQKTITEIEARSKVELEAGVQRDYASEIVDQLQTQVVTLHTLLAHV